MMKAKTLTLATSIAGALMLSSCSDEGTSNAAVPATMQIPPTDASAGVAPDSGTDAGARDLIARIPSNARGCKVLSKQEIQMYLVQNIDVIVDQAQGDPSSSGEGYYCSLRGAANINEATKQGLISMNLSVRFFRIGSPQMPDEAGLRDRWSLLQDMSGAKKKINVPGVDKALYDGSRQIGAPSVNLLVQYKNIIVWIDWSDNDPKIDQEHVTKEAADIVRRVLSRIAA